MVAPDGTLWEYTPCEQGGQNGGSFSSISKMRVEFPPRAEVIGFKRRTFTAGLFRANSKIASDEASTGQLYLSGTWHARPVTWTSQNWVSGLCVSTAATSLSAWP